MLKSHLQTYLGGIKYMTGSYLGGIKYMRGLPDIVIIVGSSRKYDVGNSN